MEQNGLVVITGAAGGIGQALVADCTARGYYTLAVVRNAREAAGRFPASVRVLEADLSTRDGIDSLISTLRSVGPIQWLIHCAGSLVMPESTDDIEQLFNINTFAPIRLSLALTSQLADAGGMVFISSTAGLWGSPRVPLYAASKSALHGFSFSLGNILKSPQRSLVVCPGPTNTPMREAFAHDASHHQSAGQVANLILDLLGKPPKDYLQELYVVRDGTIQRVSW